MSNLFSILLLSTLLVGCGSSSDKKDAVDVAAQTEPTTTTKPTAEETKIITKDTIGKTSSSPQILIINSVGKTKSRVVTDINAFLASNAQAGVKSVRFYIATDAGASPLTITELTEMLTVAGYTATATELSKPSATSALNEVNVGW